MAVRRDQWKVVFAEQRARQAFVWTGPFVTLRAPQPFHLRSDPFERAETDSSNDTRWFTERAWVAVPTQAIVGYFPRRGVHSSGPPWQGWPRPPALGRHRRGRRHVDARSAQSPLHVPAE